MAPLFCCTMPYTVARPSPVPLPLSFVVKNGSKILDSVSESMPVPVSRDRHLDVIARLQTRVRRHADLVELDVSQLDGDLPAARHRIARVDDEIHQNLLDLGRIGEHGRQIGPDLRRDTESLEPMTRCSMFCMFCTS